MTADLFVQRLAFALRVEDHFSLDPIAEVVDVRLDTAESSVLAPDGSRRHTDGTYRWANLEPGLRHVRLTSSTGRWVRFDPSPVDVVVPIADPKTALRVEMWPTPRAIVPPGVTAIRAKVVGTGVAGQRVEIAGFGEPPTGRWTLADADGELLYLLPGGPWPRTAAGDLDLTVSVPGRTVTGTQRPGGPLIASARFSIPSQGETRIRIHVT